MKLVGISGSLRSRSFNTALLRSAQGLAPMGCAIDILDIGDLPFFDEDLRSAGVPASVLALQAAIRAADGVIFATPEYNRSIPGVLKNAIDWISRPPNDQPLRDKAVTVMGVSGGMLSAALGTYHLRQIMVCLGAHVVPGPEVMVGLAAQKFDDELTLIDVTTRDFVAANLARLALLSRQLAVDLNRPAALAS